MTSKYSTILVMTVTQIYRGRQIDFNDDLSNAGPDNFFENNKIKLFKPIFVLFTYDSSNQPATWYHRTVYKMVQFLSQFNFYNLNRQNYNFSRIGQKLNDNKFKYLETTKFKKF